MVVIKDLKKTGFKILLVKILPKTNEKEDVELKNEIEQNILGGTTFFNDFNHLAKSHILRRTLGEWNVNKDKAKRIDFIMGIYWYGGQQRIISVFDVREKKPVIESYTGPKGNNHHFATWFERGVVRNDNPFEKTNYSADLGKQLQSLKNGSVKFNETMDGKFPDSLLKKTIDDLSKHFNSIKHV